MYPTTVLPGGVLLSPGERLVWCSKRRFQPIYSQGQVVGLVMVSIFLMLLAVPVAILLFAIAPWLLLLGLLGVGLTTLLLARWYRRPAYYLTTQHFIVASGLVPRVFELASLTHCTRHQQVVHSRFGRETIETGKLVLRFANGAQPVIAPQDRDGLWDLLYQGVFSRSIQLGALPALDGTPGAGELRVDLFLAKTTFTEGDTYGPLLIGPTKVIRFTERLPTALTARLYTLAATGTNGEAIEGQIEAELVRHPDAGHTLVLKRAETTLSFANDKLTVSSNGPEKVIEFEPADASRCAQFFAPTRTPYR